MMLGRQSRRFGRKAFGAGRGLRGEAAGTGPGICEPLEGRMLLSGLSGADALAQPSDDAGGTLSDAAAPMVVAMSAMTPLAGAVASAVTLHVVPMPLIFGDVATCTFTVSGRSGTPTGTVSVLLNGSPMAGASNVTLDGTGSASVTTPRLVAGTEYIEVVYSGDATYAGCDGAWWVDEDGRDLVVSADSCSRVYGEAGSALTGTINGLVDGYSVTVTYETTATQFSHPGEYVITPVLHDPDGVLRAYKVTINTGTLTISKADQTISWATPAAITYGTSLDGTQLNASVSGAAGGSAPGTLSYNEAEGTILHLGDHPLTVEAAGTQDYNPASASVTLTVHGTAPTGIATSGTTIVENQPAGTAVGTLTAAGCDPADTLTYSLVDGEGSADNASFQIVGDQLQTTSALSYDQKNSYHVRVRVTEQEGQSFEQELLISVLPASNRAPTSLTISNATVAENQPKGTVVGTLSAVDPNPGDTFTYSLISSKTYPDNASFKIVGDTLVTTQRFNYEARHSYSIRVKVTDAGGLSLTKTLTVKVTNVNEAPSGISLSSQQVVRNAPAGTVVGRLSAADPDAGQTLRYSLVAGPGSDDNAAFSIRSGQLQMARPVSVRGASSYSIRVRVTDQDGLYREKSFKITVKAPAGAAGLPRGWGVALSNKLQNTWRDRWMGV